MEQQSDCVRTCYQYTLTPTPGQEQEQALEAVVSRCRTLDNVVLEQRTTWWGRGHCKSATYYQQAKELLDLKAACPEYGEVHSQVLQDVLRRVEKTYDAFFRRLANGEPPGYPRFQGAKCYHSFTYPQYGNGAVLDGGILSLSKLGRLPIRVHRPLHGTPKTVSIAREADGWYACISCADVLVQPLPPTGRETGIDVGLRVFLSTAAGDTVETPHHYRKAARRLAKAQRHVARRTRGSHRRAKAVGWLRRTHQQVQRQRRDFHHKTALGLLRAYDVIYLEDLPVRNLVRNHHLAKRISDAAWRQVRTILAGKAAYAGRRVLAVPAHYTSQDCSGVLADGSRCPQRVRKSLSVRTHVCPRCGLVLDRDENAARNVLWAGQALRGLAGVPAGKNREAPPL
jgi:putative transposase